MTLDLSSRRAGKAGYYVDQGIDAMVIFAKALDRDKAAFRDAVGNRAPPSALHPLVTATS